MALPVVIGLGAYAYGSGPISPGLPFSVVVNDILVFIGESDNGGSLSGSGWSAAPDAPVDQPADEGTRAHILWRRATGSDSLSTSDSGNHQSGRIMCIRGCKVTGSPWNVTQSTIGEGSPANVNGDTTTVDDCLILMAISGASDNGFSGSSNSNLTNFTARFNNTTSAGNSGSIACATGELATAGPIGTTTTYPGAGDDEEWAGWIGALEPEPEPSEEPSSEEPPESLEEPSSEELESFEEPSSEEPPEEIPHSAALGIDTWQWDTPEDDLVDRDPINYYLVWQMGDQTGENIDKMIRAIRVTAKGSSPSVQIHAASPGDEIRRDELESGENPRAEVTFSTSQQARRSLRKKVRIKNLSIWAARYSGTWDGFGERDRLDELIIEGDPHGTKR